MKAYRMIKTIGFIVVTLLGAACSSYVNPNAGKPVVSDIHKTLQQSYANNVQVDQKNKQVHLPKAVDQALLPALTVEKTSIQPPVIKRFNISVKNVPANSFLMGLVKDTDYNMIVDPKVAGTVTLDLKNVTVDEILSVLHDTYGYQFKRTSYGYEVLPAGLELRVFVVNYLDINRSGKSHTSISSGEISQKVLGGGDSGGGSDRYREAKPGSSVDTSSQSDFWASLKQTLVQILGTEGDRHVIINPQAGTVIVKAYPDELREVANYLDSIQAIMTRQVILEAKILEVQLKKGFEAGVDWQVLGVSQDGASKKFNTNLDVFENIFTLGAHKGSDFSVVIDLLSTQGNVQVLSSPRISTLNNQKAVIKVGRDEFFITNISSTTGTSSDNDTVSQDVDFTPFFSGIALDVTPEIDANGSVILHIHPLISKVVDQDKTFVINDQQQSVPLALSDIRESDNIVRADNGQIVVIGGLIEDRMEEDLGSTPGVSRVPILGSLFRRTHQTGIKSELVILLRPIVVESGSWTKQIKQSAENFRKLDRGFHVGSHPDSFGNLAEWERKD